MSVLIFTIFIFTAMFWDPRSSTRRPLLKTLGEKKAPKMCGIESSACKTFLSFT
uniref:Uncharacterized protein n=1 Tax=Anguilla anguilla TaxID=7936 RepID=A0A0E9VZR2_ANGAN